MKKLAIAAAGGAALGLVVTTQVAGPLIAQEATTNRSVYEQLDLFGDIFERIRQEYVEEVDEQDLTGPHAVEGETGADEGHRAGLVADIEDAVGRVMRQH